MNILMKYEDKIKETLKEKMYPCLSEFFTEKKFNNTLDDVFIETNIEVEQGEALLLETHNKFYYKWRNNKYRWVQEDRSIDDINSVYYQEIFVIAKGLYAGPNGEVHFKEAYKVENLTQYQQKIDKILNVWRKDKEQSIFTYRYLNSKTIKQLDFALNAEMKYFIMKESLKYQDQELRPKALLTSMSSLASFDFPIDYTNKLVFGAKEVVADDRTYISNEYHIDDKSNFISNLDITELKTNALGTLLQNEKVINYIDFRILMYLVMKLIERGLSTREVNTTTAEIRDFCGFTKTKHNNREIKNSLRKLTNLTAEFFIGKRKGFSYRFIDNLFFDNTDNINQSESFNILMNQDILNQLIQEKTISMYKSSVEKLKGKASLILIYKLQSERFKLFSEEKSDMKMKINYEYFRGAFRFGNKQIIRNLQVIEKALDEILETGVTLKSYKRMKDDFHLEFYPLTLAEQKDLLPSGLKQDNLFTIQ